MTKNIIVGKYNIEVKEELSWYDTESLQATMLGGAKMGLDGNTPKLTGIDGDILLNAKIKLFELAIVSIKEEDGKTYPFSMDWLKNLSQNDGKVLDTTLDDLYNAEKKN